jgi:mRNA interferase MazF
MHNTIIKRGEVYWAELEKRSGSIQSGVRPVVIFQNEAGNKFSSTVIIVPLTSSRSKKKLPTHVTVSEECGVPSESVALMEQITTINKSQLMEKLGECDEVAMKRLNIAFLVAGGVCEVKNGKLVSTI